jgi:hypothetical protein
MTEAPATTSFHGTQRFHVIRYLGAGGMGVVYEVLDRERGIHVALKTLRTLSAEALLSLKHEFRALQDIQHPNLVSLGELVEEGGLWFYTMELVEGVDFLSHVRPPSGGARGSLAEMAWDPTLPGAERPRDEPERPRVGAVPHLQESRLRIALTQLAQGLAALHGAGKVHRDIKPSNILVTRGGRLVLLDFGLVKDIDSSRSVGEPHVVGSVHYMAPEQAASKAVGPAADWYSLGVVLYEALTGRRPYTGAAVEIMVNKQKYEPAPPRAIVPSVPRDLDLLCVDLVKFDPASRPSGREVLARLGFLDAFDKGGGAPSTSLSQNRLFVGREAECARLEEAFAQVERKVPCGVLVQGESGVGKSALVRRFTDKLIAAHPDAVVLAGRCFERESVPYKAFDDVVDALSRYLAGLPHDEVCALLPPHAALLGQVFPVLRRVKAIGSSTLPSASRAVDPQELRTRLFGAVRELLFKLAEGRRLVVVIDDLQWADADSLALFSEVLRLPGAPAMLFLATLRGVAHAVSAPSASLPDHVQRLPLLRLPEEASRQLAAILIEQAPASIGLSATDIAREAEGHPLFIDALVRHAVLRGGPVTSRVRLDEALFARSIDLPAPARRLLELVAVAGTPLPQEIVARAAGVPPGEFARCVSVLRVGNLVRTQGARGRDAILAYHDRVREAVLVHLGDDVRRSYHRELALALEASGRVDAGELALRWRGAGDRERAYAYAVRAASEAETALAFDHAAELCQMALEEGGEQGAATQALRVKLGEMLAKAGRGAAAARAYLDAVAGADHAEALELKRCAAEQFLHSGHIDEGMAAVKEVLSAVGMKLPGSPRAALMSCLSGRTRLWLRGLRYRERPARQLTAEELLRIDVCASFGLGITMVDLIHGANLQTQAVLLALKAGEPSRLARVLATEAGLVSCAGESARDRVALLLGAAEALAHKTQMPEVTAMVVGMRGTSAHLMGQFRPGLADLDECQRIIREHCTGMIWELASFQILAVSTLYYLGELAELERRVSQGLREAEHRGDRYAQTSFRTGPPVVAKLMRDDPEGAREGARDAVSRWTRKGFHLQHYWGHFAEAQTLLYQGEAPSAREELARAWPGLERSLLMRMQFLRVEALDLRARTLLGAARAHRAEQAAHCREAERDAERLMSEKVPMAKALGALVHAGVAHARGLRDETLARLEVAQRGFQASGMALHLAATHRRRGELLGGDEGLVLVEAADRWMALQNVKDPARLSAMLTPTFW